MINREDDHLYRANRPIALWLTISNIARHFCIPGEAMVLIHKNVRHLHPGENEGFLAFSDRLERERRAMVRAGAEPPMPFYKLLGFRTFVGFVSHREHERRLEQAKNQRDAIEAMPQWELFPKRRGWLEGEGVHFEQACIRTNKNVLHYKPTFTSAQSHLDSLRLASLHALGTL